MLDFRVTCLLSWMVFHTPQALATQIVEVTSSWTIVARTRVSAVNVSRLGPQELFVATFRSDLQE